MKKIVPIILLVSIFGCSHQRRSMDRYFHEMFGSPEHLIGTEWAFRGDSIGDPYLMDINSDKIFFVDMNTPYNVTAIGMSDGSVQRVISRGRGPGEILWATTLCSNDTTLTMYDNYLKSILKYHIESGNVITYSDNVETVRLDSSDEIPLKAINLSDGYIATGATSNLRQFIEYNSGGEVVCTFDEYPVNPKYAGPPEAVPFGYQGNLSSAVDLPYFAWGGADGIMFKFFARNEKGFEKVKEYVFEHPVFTGQHDAGGTGARFEFGNRAGTVSCKSSEHYHYFLYSGSVLSEHSTYRDAISGDNILVFDYLGEPVKHYKLDRKVRLFDVDASDSELICYTIDPETGLPKLFSYKLQ